jgi:N-acyl-D-aspartate/D-glutamate deacylase
MIVFSMCEEDLERIMRHPAAMIGSDGFSLAAEDGKAGSMVHPRSCGTYPRVLGRYVRQRQTLALETAIAKMTGLPTRKLGLTDRGLLRTGHAADLVVFDPDTVADSATFEAPHRYPVGIHYVVVNGQVVVQEGEHTGLLPGTVLKKSGPYHNRDVSAALA